MQGEGKMKVQEKTGKMVLSAVLMCMIIVLTMFIKIPVPMTQGYVHLGDGVVFLSVLILGKKYGAVCAGLGSAMADIFCGMVIWAPWTFVIKLGMAYIMGAILEKSGVAVSKGREIAAMTCAGAFMTAGYFAAEWIIYGNWAVAALGIPWNIGQFSVGVVLAGVISVYLCKSPAKKNFTYRLKKSV